LRKLSVPLQIDSGYLSREAQELDLGWNGFQAGVIQKNTTPGKDVWVSTAIPLRDEYRFLRKNFHPNWSRYVLCLRLILFNNPFREIQAYWFTRNVRRVGNVGALIQDAEYSTFTSSLEERMPLVSVIIPTLNRYQWLYDGLKDLENQRYKNFEVIVVDQSQPFRAEFYKDWDLSLRVWHQEEKALWRARNEAIQTAKGDYILMYDDDSRVDTDWIIQHLRALDFFKADISSGVSISAMGAKVPAHYAYFRWSDQLDTGNVLIKRSVFEKIGLFDRQFEKQRMGDGEFGLRAYLAGFKNVSNPYARRIHLKVGEGGLRQMGSWDGWRPKKLFAPRPIPSVLYLYRKYFGTVAAIKNIMTSVMVSLVPYRFKGDARFILLIILFSPLLLPFVLIQVLLSWHKSSQKLSQGAIIPKIE
jgi:glycosyltransferase involved in cell wall biosynthesis